LVLGFLGPPAMSFGDTPVQLLEKGID
jgi:hypothetical protein